MMVEVWMAEVKYRFPDDPKKAISYEDTSAAANTSSYMDHSASFPDLEQEMESMQHDNYFNGNFNIDNPFRDIDIHGEDVPDTLPTEATTTTEAGEQRIQDTIAPTSWRRKRCRRDPNPPKQH